MTGWNPLLQQVRNMRESSTYQAILNEGEVIGRIEEARKTILMLGRKRFGELPPLMQASLDAIKVGIIFLIVDLHLGFKRSDLG